MEIDVVSKYGDRVSVVLRNYNLLEICKEETNSFWRHRIGFRVLM